MAFVCFVLPLLACHEPAISELATLASTAQGSDQAAVTIVEFGDYQCGPCASLGRSLRALLEERRGSLRVLYLHCPSRHHPVGRLAAEVSAAAEELGAFWELHWLLVDEGPLTTEEDLWRAVRASGLDEDRLRALIHSGRPAERVLRDLSLADRLEVRGTPTIFVGRRRLEGNQSLEVLRSSVAPGS